MVPSSQCYESFLRASVLSYKKWTMTRGCYRKGLKFSSAANIPVGKRAHLCIAKKGHFFSVVPVPRTVKCAVTFSPRSRAAFHQGAGAPMNSMHSCRLFTSATRAFSPRTDRVAPEISDCLKVRKGVMGRVQTKSSSRTVRHRSRSHSPAHRHANMLRTAAVRRKSRSRFTAAAWAASRSCCSRCAVRSITICESLASYAFLRSRVFRACSRFRSLVTFSLSSNVIS
mmetsp:Transcript_51645/g.117601  ORF Transcript_51645/g.117601 Transcript_51645/m.117601 type:complete len:227 (+) Transcript_51645:1209-1889(+)